MMVLRPHWKFDWSLTHILHDQLHWLYVPQRVTFKSVMDGQTDRRSDRQNSYSAL